MNFKEWYELLPEIYRQRDVQPKQGHALEALLRVIAEQVEVVEADIAQLYENWFIETCADWVVPYLGDLIGYRSVTDLTDLEHLPASAQRVLIPRREVANTIRYRRRKGTLALLEELAQTVAGWPARAIEFYKLVGQTQSVKSLRLERGQTVDLRRGETLRRLGSPFDELAHTLDTRRLNSHYGRGWYNLPNVALFVWRSHTYSITQAQASPVERLPHAFTFSVLGNDSALAVRPEEGIPSIPLSRQAFAADPPAFYGPGKSIQVWAGPNRQPIPPEAIVPANLTDWQRYQAERGRVAIDPQRGRILFHSHRPTKEVWVSYYYHFAADMGGGEYERPFFKPAAPYHYYKVGEGGLDTIDEAVLKWQNEQPRYEKAVIEISDNRVYKEVKEISLGENQSLHLRAANGFRPIIWTGDTPGREDAALSVILAPGSHFTLDGLLVGGQEVRLIGLSGATADEAGEFWAETSAAQPDQTPPAWDKPARITIRHCTLLPGWTLGPECEPGQGTAYSLILDHLPNARVVIESSILGSIQVVGDEVMAEPLPIQISDSILDATASKIDALSAGTELGDVADAETAEPETAEYLRAHALLTIARSTVFGEIHTHAIDLAENSIFTGLVKVGRRQVGCMRFCYVDPSLPGTRTPRRYNCQPDLVEQTAAPAETNQKSEAERVRPHFKSVRYGAPDYAQLADACAVEIKRGAEDGSEMGAFHHLYNPQREDNLRARLAEFIPADMEVGLIIVT